MKKLTPAIKNPNNEKISMMVMSIPFFILIIMFSYVPLWGWVMAFFKYYPGLSISETEFVGLKYFVELFSSISDFPLVIRNTLMFSVLGIAVSFAPAILAIMLNEVKSNPFKRTIQTVVSFPNFISWIIIYSVVMSFFSYDDGLLNDILLKLHLISKPTNILVNAQATWVFQTVLSLWKGIGWSSIIYIAAISGINVELYEAAKIDGASRLQCIRHVTIPGLMPTYIVLLLLSIGNILSTGFEQYYVFHNPIVHDYIEVLDTYVYRVGLTQGNFSSATAVGIMKTFISIMMLISFNRLSRKLLGRTII